MPQVREYEDKFDKLEKNFDAAKREMRFIKDQVKGLMGGFQLTFLNAVKM